jgi:phosphatidylglycerol lysyltransferase
MVNGFLALFRPLAERMSERLEELLTPVSVDLASRSLDLLVGVTLIYLSVQLPKRKRMAWRIAVMVMVVAVVSHLLTSRLAATTLTELLGLMALVTTRDYFRARSELASINQGLVALAASIVVALLYGTLGFWLMLRRDFGIDFTLNQAIVHTLRAYTLMGDPDLIPRTRQAAWFLDSLAIAGTASIGFGLYSLFRPVSFRLQVLPEEIRRMTSLLERYSRSSDDYFKIWPHDKAYMFANGAGVAYGVKSGVAISVGDPVVADGKLGEAIRAFDAMCLTSGWSPAFLYIGEWGLGEYRRVGLDTLKVGEDAVVDLNQFAEETSRNKHFRNIRNRFEKAGYRVEQLRPPHDPQLMRQLGRISRAWLRQPGRQEWRFFAGRFSLPYLRECDLFVAYDSDGLPRAFVNLIPVWRKGWATIDLMRSDGESPGGIMDYLLMDVMLHLGNAGVQKFNLGLAPLSGLGEPAGKPEERLLNLIYRSNQKLVSLKGLRQFKSKFEPEWEAKYLAYRGGSGRLPRIAYALARTMT